MKQELNRQIVSYLKQNQPLSQPSEFQVSPLSPDGSDRIYYRITAPRVASFIATDASGCSRKEVPTGLSQNNSFRIIQQHLEKLGFPVPKFLAPKFANDELYLLQDLGNITLYNFVKQHGWCNKTIAIYRNVLTLLLRLQTEAAETFNPDWAYAGGFYNHELIVERELNYFLKAFIIDYCKIKVNDSERTLLTTEFTLLADSAMQAPANFFLYRDFQSKNLMLHRGEIFLIDFQGARLGPCYYDLAALINDPYTEIPLTLRSELKEHFFAELKVVEGKAVPEMTTFDHYFSIFSLIRTLQTLGAFGYLSQRGKKHFTQYIRPALTNLDYYLSKLNHDNQNFNLSILGSICNKVEL
ncbi:MAG: phosphotransferase [Deltaproteobacteria bacterium]|nr:phosphotransferase [Deltaproteobacteria bacterium]MCK5679404.1 phosphotransferase [bacterium]